MPAPVIVAVVEDHFMTLAEHVKFSLYYDGLSKGEYESVVPLIMKENVRRLKIYNIVAFAFTFSLFILSLFWEEIARKTFVYLGASVCNLLMILILYSRLNQNGLVTKIINYFFSSLMLLFTIYIGTVKSNGLPATTFFAALALIPYITYNRVIFSFFHRLAFLVLFFVLSARTKSPEFLRADIINGVSVFILSTLAGIRVQKLQVKGWSGAAVLNNELRKMSCVFETIRVIDLRANTSVDYSTDGDIGKKIIGSSSNASLQMDRFIDEWVSDRNELHMRQFCDLSTLEDRIFGKKSLVCDFATSNVAWFRASFVPFESDAKGFSTKVVFSVQKIADAYYLGMLNFDLNNIN